jgi:hypothetical protein
MNPANSHQKDDPRGEDVTPATPSRIVADRTARQFVESISCPWLWEKAYQP